MDQVFGHRAFRVGVAHLEFDQAADRAASVGFGDARPESFVEFGPTMPFVLARASVREPHLATNCCLPVIRLALSAPLTEQPAAPSASAATIPHLPTRSARPAQTPAATGTRGRESGL